MTAFVSFMGPAEISRLIQNTRDISQVTTSLVLLSDRPKSVLVEIT